MGALGRRCGPTSSKKVAVLIPLVELSAFHGLPSRVVLLVQGLTPGKNARLADLAVNIFRTRAHPVRLTLATNLRNLGFVCFLRRIPRRMVVGVISDRAFASCIILCV